MSARDMFGELVPQDPATAIRILREKLLDAMRRAAHAFAITIEDGYESWACEVVEKRVVNVREWCAANAPEWLAQLPAVEPEEGGDHG